jgi:FkbM family methyltransferase
VANIGIQKDPFYTFKKIFRTAKTLVPSLTDAKYAAQRIGRRLVHKPHEKDFRALAMPNEPKAQENFVFIDIGANRGQTIDSVRLYKDYQIYSIEANTLLAQKLKRQRESNDRLEILNYAMSNTVGETTLYIPKYRNYTFDGLASMIRAEAESWLDATRLYGFRRELLSVIEMRVPTTIRPLESYT